MKDYTYAVIDLIQSDIKDNYFCIRNHTKELSDETFKNEFGLNCVRKINYLYRKIRKNTFVVMVGDYFYYSRHHGDLWRKHKRDKEYTLFTTVGYSVPCELLDFDNDIKEWLFSICRYEMEEEMLLLGWVKNENKTK